MFAMFAERNLLLTLLIAFFCCQSYADDSLKRIAIIGAGAAGSSTAYYLERFAQQSNMELNITVFERNSYVGGRTTTVNAYGNSLESVEVGASIFVDINTILMNATALFGLTQRGDANFQESVGIWNGNSFVYTQNTGMQFWDVAKLFWKYGLDPMRIDRLVQSVVGRFKKLYEGPFFPFRSLSDRARELDLASVSSQTGAQLIAANGIRASFSTEIVQASTRINYGQNVASIHGLETIVSMVTGTTYQIQGGNWRIFDRMLQTLNATTLLDTTISSISKSDGKYNVKIVSKDSITQELLEKEEPFDTVVLAGPFQYADIEFERDLLNRVPDEIPYVTLHVTLFTSKRTMSPSFFKLAPGESVPTTILTTLPPGEVPDPTKSAGSPGFFTITTLNRVVNPSTLDEEYLYKVFSREELDSSFLSRLLGTDLPNDLSTVKADSGDAITWYYHKVWQAYPYGSPRSTFEELELARDFYYTGGMESFISTMETNALMGMNVAKLIVDDYRRLSEEQASRSGQAVITDMELD
ncbi:uncharacterized protein L3040_003634 [Drepanopeziza brunnea f. sp. 'multigermtubi']|uniref:Prenylcysteine oxidoreductase n=1 Tax=Marssonina brunnea f. sp. multigermtubi (strain MB_m1) TaxID=1072389 RepID=K1WPG9_MARBU|nr:prenylcysteine oxidoreductase [Drepanopeziza brunnea f. sp. 'multigermtubi' MB_m1]EKD14227.1 prenylcysteine oxidoreductase [Drepanopeziza brunnea f. sp. 'multigermtubi' MB_m1]KAJ5046390.1 hypothetical protein L3040_003634 [Drepanopeziza brunnea f. sp. 'multigermtubi']